MTCLISYITYSHNRPQFVLALMIMMKEMVQKLSNAESMLELNVHKTLEIWLVFHYSPQKNLVRPRVKGRRFDFYGVGSGSGSPQEKNQLPGKLRV